MSESIEMYLVMTALLRSEPQQPVPVSLLANKLGVSQVSANEMCHKLDERGLLAYQPYKGVTLTEHGETQAQQILSRRRLWVMFLVENLGIEPEEADDLACQLEHITSERLVTALKAFLEHAPGARQRAFEAVPMHDLTHCTAGTRGVVASVAADPMVAAFLRAQGLVPGMLVEVLAISAEGAVLVGLGNRHVALAPSMATQIMLAPPSADHSLRHRAWARCSAYWSCPHSDTCECVLDYQVQ